MKNIDELLEIGGEEFGRGSLCVEHLGVLDLLLAHRHHHGEVVTDLVACMPHWLPSQRVSILAESGSTKSHFIDDDYKHFIIRNDLFESLDEQ